MDKKSRVRKICAFLLVLIMGASMLLQGMVGYVQAEPNTTETAEETKNDSAEIDLGTTDIDAQDPDRENDDGTDLSDRETYVSSEEASSTETAADTKQSETGTSKSTENTEETDHITAEPEDRTENVCQIGSVLYASLKEAYEAATDEDTIELLQETTLSETLTVEKTITIDLNGHVINGKATKEQPGPVIIVAANGNLTMNDSNPEAVHYGKASEESLWVWEKETPEEEKREEYQELTGGIITGGYAEESGGGIVVEESGNLTMNGGTIAGNVSTEGNGGGLQLKSGANAELKKVTIAWNMAKEGGGIETSGNLTITESQIGNNTAAEGNGGGILVQSGATTLKNVAIKENTVPEENGKGSAFYVKSGNLTITDGADSIDGTVEAESETGTITLPDGYMITEENKIAVKDIENTEEEEGVPTAADLDAESSESAGDGESGIEKVTDNDIYFDLNAGKVTITNGNYTGYRYENGEKKEISGKHATDNQYYVYQSTASNYQETGLVNGAMYIPTYDEVMWEGKTWSEYITNNNDVDSVITNWEEAIKATGRTATKNQIKITGTDKVSIVFDNLYSTYATTSYDDGPVYVNAAGDRKITIKLKGDSRFRNIYYLQNNVTQKGSLTITSYEGDNNTKGSMTVASFSTTMKRDNDSEIWPDCLAVIGAAAMAEYGLTFSGGTVFAGFPAQTNRVWDTRGTVAFATCVGGGNNNIGQVTITGGRLTAVSNGTSPAIGGGDIQGQFLLKSVLGKGASAEKQKEGRCEFIMTGGKIHDTSATNKDYPDRQPNGGAVWMDDLYGIVTISGGTIDGCEAQNGGAVYMTNGTFTLTGTGQIINCKANDYLDSETNTTVSSRGGAVYLGGGRAIIGVDRKLNENSKNETLSYIGLTEDNAKTPPLEKKITNSLSSEEVNSLTCSIQSCSATYGGAVYVDGNIDDTENTYDEDVSTSNSTIDPSTYNVYISGGTLKENTAASDGGGVCVNNGHVLMDGGTVENNHATNGNGGGLYLSSIAKKDARVRIRSGSITNNSAGKNGGAIAVEGKKNSEITLKVTVGVNETHYDKTNGEFIGCEHINDGTTTEDCPVLKENKSAESGGAIYITGGENTILNIYCLDESDNSAEGDKDGKENQSDFLMVEGGKVIITTGDKSANEDADEGHTVITGSIHILGGSLDIYGEMKNPLIENVITVDLQSEKDHFEDHRIRLKTDPKIYWVHYYENFPVYDENGELLYRTGRFKAFPIEEQDQYVHVIRSTLFSRSGYLIQGWHTTQDGTDTATKTDNAYQVGDTYTFPSVQTHKEYDEEGNEKTVTNEDGTKTTEISDLIANTDYVEKENGELTTLVLYAIWDQGNYRIRFDANSDEYTGTMANMACKSNQTYQLTKNAYISPGMKFHGWNTKRDGSGTSYADEAEVKDLTTVDGGTVTLYAQWEPCTHPEETMIYTADGNTMTQICSICYGHTATASISADSVDYNKNHHPANPINYSDEWIGEKNLEIQYTMKADAIWDFASGDTAKSDWEENPTPLHAGNYTASISKTGCDNKEAVASVEYEIYRTKWATPESPEIEVEIINGEPNTVTITSPIDDDLLRYARNTTDSVITDRIDVNSPWQESPVFQFDNDFNNIYYFFAMKAEDRDHEQSEPSKSVMYVTSNGIVIILKVQEGISLEATTQEGDGNFTFTTSIREGYHWRNYNHADEIVISKTDGTEISDSEAKTLLDKKETPDEDNYSYSLNNLGDAKISGATITITVKGTAKDAEVAAKAIDGQKFIDFSGNNTMISRDSAFTSRFTVKNFIPEEYETPKVVFGTPLPRESTVILKTKGKYYYYNVPDDTVGVSTLSINQFTAMGAADRFTYDSSDTAVGTLQYQFIVDFSQVEEEKRLTEESLTMDLVLTPSATLSNGTTSNYAPAVEAKDPHQITISLKTKAQFTLEASNDNRLTGTLTGTYTASEGAASIWNNRDMALVLTLENPDQVPADLYLKTQIGEKNIISYRNQKNQFILPLSSVDSMNAVITLCSGMFPSDEKVYWFDAQWFVSASEAGSAPLNGYEAAKTKITFQVEKEESPSLRVTGTDRLCKAGDTLNVTLDYLDIPDGATIKAELLWKDDTGTYLGTGWSKTENGTGTKTYSLSGQTSGSFCLMYTIYSREKENLLQVPYYFIIMNGI